MRKCKVFVGNSHPQLGNLVCENLGIEPAPATLKNFANGETSVQIGVSVRDEDVYIIQSGSQDVNDHIMELLILISACKGGSASKITAVIPQFPYSKQSKMKKHRGAITARMLANLLVMAGADHVVSMDLHASQMQGFFSKPVDNLYAGPTLAKWIKENIKDFKNAVVVSKNPGGTKRVTALADHLKINFAMIHTDRRRSKDNFNGLMKHNYSNNNNNENNSNNNKLNSSSNNSSSTPSSISITNSNEDNIASTDIQTARIVKGHVLEDLTDDGKNDIPVKPILQHKESELNFENNDSDDEDEPEFNAEEKIITLVGNVQNRPAIIVDDMIDKHTSFIAAAEHLRLNCGANSCYIVATHGIFNNDCLERLNDCPYIDGIIVTNTYPISEIEIKKNQKLTVIDVSPIFAECIRRDHFGESISVLFDSLASIV